MMKHPAVAAVSIAVSLALGACKEEEPAPKAAPKPQVEPAPKPANMIGVSAEDFECDAVATTEQVAEALGVEVVKEDPLIAPPAGLARPCAYSGRLRPAGEGDGAGKELDERAKQRLEAAREEERKRKIEALREENPFISVNQAAQLVDGADSAHVTWSYDIDCRDRALRDAESLMARYQDAPGATEVEVGRRGLDHNNAALLFIDDDAPCYVRVLGPDAEQRLALARLVAAGLTPKNAPLAPPRFARPGE
jgi:hypothetical protein